VAEAAGEVEAGIEIRDGRTSLRDDRAAGGTADAVLEPVPVWPLPLPDCEVAELATAVTAEGTPRNSPPAFARR